MIGPINTGQGTPHIARVIHTYSSVCFTSAQINAFYETWIHASQMWDATTTVPTTSLLNQMVASFMNFYEQFQPFGPPANSPLSEAWSQLTSSTGIMPSGSLASLIQGISRGSESLSSLILVYPLEQLKKLSLALDTAQSSMNYAPHPPPLPPPATFHQWMEFLNSNCHKLTGNPIQDQKALNHIIEATISLYSILTGPRTPKPLDGLCQAYLNYINAPIGFVSCPESSLLSMCTSNPPDYLGIEHFLYSKTGVNGSVMLQRLFTQMGRLGEYL